MQRVFAFCEGWAQAWDMSWFGNGHGMGCALDAQAFECTHVHGIVAGVGLLTWGESDASGSRGHGWAGHNRKHLFTIRGGALKKMIINARDTTVRAFKIVCGALKRTCYIKSQINKRNQYPPVNDSQAAHVDKTSDTRRSHTSSAVFVVHRCLRGEGMRRDGEWHWLFASRRLRLSGWLDI